MLFDDILIRRHKKIREADNKIYIAPHPLLRNYIAHYTIFYMDNSVESDELTLIPDSSGCIIYAYENNNISSSIWGATTQTVRVKDETKSRLFRFFIEFMPGGLHAFTGISQSELCDMQTEVKYVDNRLNGLLTHAIEVSHNVDDMIFMTDTIFLKALEEKLRINDIISSALKKISTFNGILTVKDLAANEYVSERHLNRLFNEYIGVNVKTFLRITRVNHTVRMLKKNNYESCLKIAQEFGYFDESHFSHDFKRICGVSPKMFFENISSFYNEPFKY